MREVGARLVVAVQGRNLVVVGAGQLVLRRNHFDIVGHAGLKAVARLRHFFVRQIHAQIGDIHLGARGFQLRDGGFHFERDPVPQVRLLLRELLQFDVSLCDLAFDSAAGKKRNLEIRFVIVGRNHAGGRQTLHRPGAGEAHLRQSLIPRFLLLQCGGTHLGGQGLHLGTLGEGPFHALIGAKFLRAEELCSSASSTD